MVTTPDHPQVVYSVGHSNQTVENLLRLLSAEGIQALVDVRSQPYSQHAPQFNHESLRAAVEDAGLEYVFAGDTLGGRPRDRRHYDAAGRALYFKMAASDEFQQGVSRLMYLARERGPVAMMCSEEDPTNCHRRLLVARVLAEHGVEVRHIRGDGRVQLEMDLVAVGKVSTFGQRGFFDQDEASSWKSTRSVLAAVPPSSSSSH